MLKEKMLVSVPALEAEMRGLRNGMELEKTKEEVEILHAQLEAMNRRLAQFEDEESSGEESEEVEDSETNRQAPVQINLRKSSMFVTPANFMATVQSHSPPPTLTPAPSAIVAAKEDATSHTSAPPAPSSKESGLISPPPPETNFTSPAPAQS
jgi:hypothetical protein